MTKTHTSPHTLDEFSFFPFRLLLFFEVENFQATKLNLFFPEQVRRMECGKLRSPSNGSSSASPGIIFYFIVDVASPSAPVPDRAKSYYVTTFVDSYVEAFHFLVRSLCIPANEATLRPWHALFTRVFGTVTYDAFLKSVQTVSLSHFTVDTSEDAARSRLTTGVTAASASSRPGGGGDVTAAGGGGHHHRTSGGGGDETAPSMATNLTTVNGTAVRSIRGDPTVSPPRGGPGGRMGGGGAGARQGDFDTSFTVYPRDTKGLDDARVELHRLRAELAETSGRLNVEKNRSQVTMLSHAEREAIMYQLEQARQEASSEKAKARDASEKLRVAVMDLDDRLRRLQEQHEQVLRDRAQKEHLHLTSLEEQFLEKQQETTRSYDTAIRDRDRKLSKAISRVKVIEQHLEDALKRIEEQKMTISSLTANLSQVASERNTLEEEVRRLQRHGHALELQVEDAQHQLGRIDESNRHVHDELAKYKAIAAKLQRENDRFSMFASSLQSELRTLDDSAVSAVELLRRKVLSQRNDANTAYR